MHPMQIAEFNPLESRSVSPRLPDVTASVPAVSYFGSAPVPSVQASSAAQQDSREPTPGTTPKPFRVEYQAAAYVSEDWNAFGSIQRDAAAGVAFGRPEHGDARELFAPSSSLAEPEVWDVHAADGDRRVSTEDTSDPRPLATLACVAAGTMASGLAPQASMEANRAGEVVFASAQLPFGTPEPAVGRSATPRATGVRWATPPPMPPRMPPASIGTYIPHILVSESPVFSADFEPPSSAPPQGIGGVSPSPPPVMDMCALTLATPPPTGTPTPQGGGYVFASVEAGELSQDVVGEIQRRYGVPRDVYAASCLAAERSDATPSPPATVSAAAPVGCAPGSASKPAYSSMPKKRAVTPQLISPMKRMRLDNSTTGTGSAVKLGQAAAAAAPSVPMSEGSAIPGAPATPDTAATKNPRARSECTEKTHAPSRASSGSKPGSKARGKQAVAGNNPKEADTPVAPTTAEPILPGEASKERQAARSRSSVQAPTLVEGQRSSNFRGVCWKRRERRWESKIKHGGLQHHCGHFDTENDAARAYDLKAIELKGTAAQLNFPDSFDYVKKHGLLDENGRLRGDVRDLLGCRRMHRARANGARQGTATASSSSG